MHLTQPPRTHPLLTLVAVAWPLLTASGSAQAQSAYTLSVLSKPSSHKSAAPFALDAAGNAYGGGTYLLHVSYDFGGIGSCWVCKDYRYQEVKWPASQAATVSGTLGLKDFLPRTVTGDGSVLAGHLSNATGDGALLVPSISTDGSPWVPVLPTVVTAIKRGSTLTPLKPPAGFLGFTLEATNNAGVLVGQNYLEGTLGSSEGPVALSHNQGKFAALDGDALLSKGQQYPAAINDSQWVVGTVFAPDPDTGQRTGTVTLWMPNGGGTRTKLGGIKHVRAEAINNAGQVLMHHIPIDAPWPLSTYIWQNDALTPVTGSLVKGQSVVGAAMNDAGTVVGCLYNQNQNLSRAAHTPFIWRNGVMENLSTYLAGKGLKLASGTALGCPYAINNAGTILASTYQISNEKNTSWVRLNAKP